VAENRAIGFDNAFVNNGTRSIVDPSLTNSSLENFDVYGFVTNTSGNSSKIFGGDDVTKEGGNWNYTNTQYWIKDNTYTFGAIAPANAATVSGEAITGETNKKVGMTVEFTNDGNTDLLHAAPNAVTVGTDDYNTAVAMVFNHQLSKVKFSFTNAVGTGYSVMVTDVKITDAKATGILKVSGEKDDANTWESQDGKLELDFGHVVADKIEEGPEVTNEAVLIANGETKETYNEKLMIPTPAENITYTVTFTAKLYQAGTLVGTYPHTVTISNQELALGYCYDFTAELNAKNIVDPENPLSPITFTASVGKDWLSGGEPELKVPEAQIP
jgi:hypothetical protein